MRANDASEPCSERAVNGFIHSHFNQFMEWNWMKLSDELKKWTKCDEINSLSSFTRRNEAVNDWSHYVHTVFTSLHFVFFHSISINWIDWSEDRVSEWYYNSKIILYFTKTACTLLPYSILDLIKVDTTYLRTVILTASVLSLFTVII